MARKPPPPKKTTRTTTTSSARRTRSKRRRKTKKRSSEPRLVWLGFGSNVGDRRAHLEAALSHLARIASLRRVSAFYLSDPVGYANQPDFWNAAAEIHWRGSPEALLEAIQKIEKAVGRRPTFSNGPREIDVDILDFDGIVRTDSDPLLPHPKLAERRFALAPLAEIAPTWRHPILRQTAQELLERLPARPGARRIRKNL